MAKTNLLDISAAYQKARGDYMPFDPGLPGADRRFGRPADYSFNRMPSPWPLAYLWRRFVTLTDALRFLRSDDPGPTPGVADELAALAECEQTLDALNEEDDRYHDELKMALQPLYDEERPVRPDERPLFDRLGKIRDDIQRRRDENSARARQLVRHLSRPARREALDSVLEALGGYPFDYAAARLEIEEWKRETLRALGAEAFSFRVDVDPRHAVGRELETTVEPLIDAHENPRRFFCEVLPRIGGWDLQEERLRGDWHLFPRRDGRPVWPYTPLAEALHEWGFGLLLNPTVRAAFEAASTEPTFALVLAEAEGREAFRDTGRRPRTDIDLEAERKAYREAPRGSRTRLLEKRAAALDIQPKTLLRYITGKAEVREK